MTTRTRPKQVGGLVLSLTVALALALGAGPLSAQVCEPLIDTLSESNDTVLANDFCDSEVAVDCDGDQGLGVLIGIELNGPFGVNLRCSTPDGAKLCIFDSTCGDLGAATVRSDFGIVDVSGNLDDSTLSILILDIGPASLCGDGTNVSCAGNWGTTTPPDDECVELELRKSGTGAPPTAAATSSSCEDGLYAVGETVQLTAMPASGWTVERWQGTNNDTSSQLTNTVTIKSENNKVVVVYIQNDVTGFNSPFNFADFRDWSDRRCSNCGEATAAIATGTTDLPLGSYVSNGWGEHRGELRGPADADFDLALQWWSGSEWIEVANALEPGSVETVTHEGPPGLYRWQVTAVSGSGGYSLAVSRPEKNGLASGLSQANGPAQGGANSLRSEYMSGTSVKDFLIDTKPAIGGGEKSYEVSFYVRPESELFIKGKKHQVFDVARPQGNKTKSMLTLFLRSSGGGYEVRGKVTSNAGKFKSDWTEISADAWTKVAFEWRAASDNTSTDGSVAMTIDGTTEWSQVLKNGKQSVVESKLGQIKGTKKANQGVVYFDEFRSSWNN